MAKKKAAVKSSAHLIGSWSFLVGIILAILLGLNFTGGFAVHMWWAVFLVGIIVGLLNVAHDEVNAFLTSGTILALLAFLGSQAGVFAEIAPVVRNVLQAILTLFIPATIIVALKSVFVLARS